jgi:arylsulfatase A-like enzyme
MLAEVDHQVGRLLDTLSALSVDEDTIVVFSSDHGEFLGDHGLMSKLGFHDQAYHIPLIVRYPALGGPGGLVVDEFTENVDIMPTVLDLVGLPVPAQCQGRSLRPFLEGGSVEGWRTSTHWEFDFRVFAREAGLLLTACNLAAHRDRSGKYVHFAGMPPIFYDLESDPDETRPLHDHPEMARYAAELLDWRMRSDDETLARRLATPHGMLTLEDPPLTT